jgi:hypothetical protein
MRSRMDRSVDGWLRFNFGKVFDFAGGFPLGTEVAEDDPEEVKQLGLEDSLRLMVYLRGVF